MSVQIKELAQNYIEWMSWIGENPSVHAHDRDKMDALNSDEFVLTYMEKFIIKGLDNLEQHFLDVFKQVGHWHHEIHNVQALNDYTALTQYNVVTTKKGSTPCTVLFVFDHGKCVGAHEVVVNLEGVLDLGADFVRTT